MRGDKRLIIVTTTHNAGSPPHARGQVDLLVYALQRLGITPACAGTSQSKGFCNLLAKDHPRMRGDKALHLADLVPGIGSPPHARGQGTGSLPRDGLFGITPACAGTSSL